MRNMTMLDRWDTKASPEECPTLPPKSNKGWGRVPNTRVKTWMRVILVSVGAAVLLSVIPATADAATRRLGKREMGSRDWN
ncbi:MAG TPA: hypothetical protein VM848_12030 [Acidimicrobiia bacterium]|nr:hypothetical protein [Acidimicrobiia bacterium]